MGSFTNNNRAKAQRGYNRIAVFYDLAARIFFFNKINKSQVTLLPFLTDFKSCLILGGGSGYFLQQILSQHKTARFVYVDLSDRMIQMAQKRIKRNFPEQLHRIEFRCASVEDVKNESFDLIVCNYFLDLFPNVEADLLLKRFYSEILSSNGYVYFTDFAIPESHWIMKKMAEALLKMLYYIFRIATFIRSTQLPDFPYLFKKNNFELFHETSFSGGIMTSAIYKKRHPLTS
jgi:tRNA (cmo5U34)-methyltransferase